MADNLKVSHKDQAILGDFLSDFRNEFGQEDKLTENKKTHSQILRYYN